MPPDQPRPPNPPAPAERIIVVAASPDAAAPTRDALARTGIASEFIAVEGLGAELDRSPGIVVLVEAGLPRESFDLLTEAFRDRTIQLNIPVIRILPPSAPPPEPGETRVGPLGMAFVLEAPPCPATLASLVRVARHARERMIRARRTEEILRERETEYRSMFQLASVGMGQADPSGRFIRVNDRMCEITGYDRSELIGTSVRELTHPDDREADWALFQRMLRGEVAEYRNVKRYVRKDGRVIWVDVTARGVRDPDGRLLRTIAIVQDITERKRAEDDLRESEERFRTLADNIDQLAWIADEHGRIAWANKRWLEYTGVPASEIRPEEPDMVHPEHRGRVAGSFRRSFSEGVPFDDTFPLLGRDGYYHWFLSRAVPVRDETGHIHRWLMTATDVTDSRKVEEALTDANRRLAEADRRKDEFLAILAHELRNPLAPIRNASEILGIACADEPDLRRQRDVIDRQVTHMARLLDDLLDVSRITRGLVRLRIKPVELGEVLARAVESAQPFVEARRHRLAMTRPPERLVVAGDYDRLIQIVANLLTNAARYTSEGGEIALDLRREGDRAVIRVRDNGEGIDPSQLDKIFEPFTTAAPSTGMGRPEGLGLGLSLAKQLVDLHDGTIEAHSEGKGRGSEFVVELPLLREKEREAQFERRPRARAATKRRTIMIVDDMKDTADSLGQLMTVLGHEVRVAYDGPSALATFKEFTPWIVFLDIGMPGMDGYETARRLRDLDGGGEVRLVAMTGYGRDEDRKRAREAGFDFHLTKPVEIAEIKKLLESD